LLEVIPDEHKQFLANLDWVHDTVLSGGIRVVAVHAGLLPLVEFSEQLESLKNRDYRFSHIEWLSGRENVREIHPALKRENGFLVSGHHGDFSIDGRRFIIDDGGGRKQNPIRALFLPEGKTITSDF